MSQQDQGLDIGGPIEELAEVPEEVAEVGEHRRAVRDALNEVISLLGALNSAGQGGGGGAQRISTEPIRVDPEGAINIETETWTTTAALPLQSGTSDIGYATDLTPGDERTIVEATSTESSIVLDVVGVGSTLHEADIDGDGQRESVIRYHYEYQNEVDGQWNRIDGLTGIWPRGTLTEPLPPVPGSVIGPVYGFRIQYENLTDEAGLTATSIPTDEPRSIIQARGYHIGEGPSGPGR